MNRKTIFLLLALLIGGFSIQGFSQDIPKRINYQAVARDAQGKELINKSISVRFSLVKSADGSVTWIETQTTTTDQFGLFNLIIGDGSMEPGSEVADFDEIDWGAAHYSLKVEVDFGSGFRHVGTMPFLSVPYALYAAKAGNGGGSGSDDQSLIWDPVNQHITIEDGEGLIDLESYMQTLSVDGRNLSVSGGNSVVLPTDADADSTNELQTLSLSGNVLSIKQRNTTTNSVTLNFDDADANPANEIQDLTLDGSILSLTKDPSPTGVDLDAFDNQTLSADTVNHRLTIANGNYVRIDASPTNEIQDLALNGSLLTLSKDPSPTSIDIESFDNQSLSKTGNTLSISGGNSVAIDTDPANEIQDLAFTPLTNILKVTNNAAATNIDLSKYQQSLSINSNQLTISSGNTVDLKQPLIAFRALAKSTLPISANDSTTIQFKSEQLDYGSGFDSNSGIFTVPINGEGLYQFSLSYNYSDNQTIRLVKNEGIIETLQKFNSYYFMLYLYPGDMIYLRLVNTTSFGTIGIASFMATRIIQ